MKPPTVLDFRAKLDEIFKISQSKGLSYIDVKSGDLHRKIGGYPSSNHRMPVCCDAMKQNLQPGDIVLDEPPKGIGATLKIRYKIPR